MKSFYFTLTRLMTSQEVILTGEQLTPDFQSPVRFRLDDRSRALAGVNEVEVFHPEIVEDCPEMKRYIFTATPQGWKNVESGEIATPGISPDSENLKALKALKVNGETHMYTYKKIYGFKMQVALDNLTERERKEYKVDGLTVYDFPGYNGKVVKTIMRPVDAYTFELELDWERQPQIVIHRKGRTGKWQWQAAEFETGLAIPRCSGETRNKAAYGVVDLLKNMPEANFWKTQALCIKSFKATGAPLNSETEKPKPKKVKTFTATQLLLI